MKGRKKYILSLSIFLMIIFSSNISFTTINNDKEWIIVGENEDYEMISQVMKENKAQLIKIKLVDEIHYEENIEINQQVIIKGFSKEKTTIQGCGKENDENARIFNVLPEGNLTLENLIIEKGYVNEHPRAGSGIYNMGTCHVINCVIQKNIGTYGVGVFSVGDLEIDSSLIQYNISVKRPVKEDAVGLGCAGSGGGVKIQRGNFIINNTLIKNNTAVRTGGGVKVSCLAKGTINNSIITGNVAKDFGGGLSINGEASLNRAIIFNNASHRGGGIHLAGTLDLESCILLNNDILDLELMLSNQNFSPTLRKNNNNIIIDSLPSVYNFQNGL